MVSLAGLRGWILDHVTAIHSVEFSAFHPAGFAGACDALVDLDGEGPFIVDWKTTGKSIHKSNESQLHNYRHQTGAYSLMLNYRTGIQAVGGAVVVARRSGSPTVERLDLDALKAAEDAFLGRMRYFLNLLFSSFVLAAKGEGDEGKHCRQHPWSEQQHQQPGNREVSTGNRVRNSRLRIMLILERR